MPEFNPDILAQLAAQEAELGPRGSQPLPATLYSMVVSEEDSEVLTDGPPTLKLAFKVIEPETVTVGDVESKTVGRFASNRIFWFAKEDDTKAKSVEERQAITRRMSTEFIQDLAYQLLGAGFDSECGNLLEAIGSMQTDDEDIVAEMMEAIVGIIDGHDFFIQVSIRKTDDGSEFNNLRPYSYQKGNKNDPAAVAESRALSYEKGADRMGLVDEAAMAQV